MGIIKKYHVETMQPKGKLFVLNNFFTKFYKNFCLKLIEAQNLKVDRLVVWKFNATLTASVISRRSVTHMSFLAFSHQYQHEFLSKATDYFSHRDDALAEVTGENTPNRNFASTGSRTHNHQVMTPTRSPLGHSGGALKLIEIIISSE